MRMMITIICSLLVASAVAGNPWHNVTITIYNPVSSQCDADPLTTADNSKIDLAKLKDGKLRWIAVSRDLLKKFPYGTKVYVWIAPNHPYNGVWRVKDTMNARYTNRIDLLTYNRKYGKWSGQMQLNG